MNTDLYVGMVENPLKACESQVVAIATTMTKAVELVDKWIEKHGNPAVRYRVRLWEIDQEWIELPQSQVDTIRAILGQIRL